MDISYVGNNRVLSVQGVWASMGFYFFYFFLEGARKSVLGKTRSFYIPFSILAFFFSFFLSGGGSNVGCFFSLWAKRPKQEYCLLFQHLSKSPGWMMMMMMILMMTRSTKRNEMKRSERNQNHQHLPARAFVGKPGIRVEILFLSFS